MYSIDGYRAFRCPQLLTDGIGEFIVSVFNSNDIFFSKNLFNSSTAQFAGNDPYLITHYSCTTNANGQVIFGIGTDAKTGVILQYDWFTYR